MKILGILGTLPHLAWLLGSDTLGSIGKVESAQGEECQSTPALATRAPGQDLCPLFVFWLQLMWHLVKYWRGYRERAAPIGHLGELQPG
jgi:hypothetical protein